MLIVTDCRAVRQGFDALEAAACDCSSALMDLWQELARLLEDRPREWVIVRWIPSHVLDGKVKKEEAEK
eukprot:15434062-Alexandrium_andersonii.AAC.1